jgi:Bacterial tandem repeat domain 1
MWTSKFIERMLCGALLVLVLATKFVSGLDYYAERSIPSATYQAHFDQWVGNGYRLVLCTGFDDLTGNVLYNTIWHKNAGVNWKAYHGLTESQYQTNFNTNTADGYRPVFVDGFSMGGSPRINVIYHKETEQPTWAARHGQSSANYQAAFDSLVGSGFDLDIVSSYETSGAQRVASLFSRFTNNDAWSARHGMSSAGYQSTFTDLVGQGYTLEYVSAGTVTSGSPLFAALFVKSNGSPGFLAYHDVADANVQATLDTAINDGYIPKVIDAYRNGSEILWALLLTKEGDGRLGTPAANDATFTETRCFDQKIVDFLTANDIPGAAVAVLQDGKL